MGMSGSAVLPEDEEVLVCTLRSSGVACHRIRTTDLEMSQCSQRAVCDEAAVLHEFLELVSGFMWLVQREVRYTPEVGRIHRRAGKQKLGAQFHVRGCLQSGDGIRWVV